MNYYIVDLKRRSDVEILQKISNTLTKQDNTTILSLTPYSCYLLDKLEIEYITYHTLVSEETFRNLVLEKLDAFKTLIGNNEVLLSSLYHFSKFINHFVYLSILYHHLSRIEGDIFYITDSSTSADSFSEKSLLNNEISLIPMLRSLTVVRFSENIDRSFYSKEQKKAKIRRFVYLLRSGRLKRVVEKLLFNDKTQSSSLPATERRANIQKTDIDISKTEREKINHFFLKNFPFISEKIITHIVNAFEHSLQKVPQQIKYRSFTFLSDPFSIMEAVSTKKSPLPAVFEQHGSYLYKNIFLYTSEIRQADVNIVYNEYTKKLFQKLGAKKILFVEENRFNIPVKKRRKKFDFLYLLQGHDYSGMQTHVDFDNSLHSFDGYQIYLRHRSIIQLFGEKFKNKKIVLRPHPYMITYGLYVPLIEISEKYNNVAIDFSTPVHTLIEKSRFLISDYYSSEFLSRDLFYNRDIILFQGAPTPLPADTFEDMKKLFILVETIEDFKKVVTDIETLTKQRKRHDSLIEYYASRKCDARKSIQQIVEQEIKSAERR